jgi:hypothetical protein
MSANATDPLMVPAVDTIVISLAVNIHFEKILTEYARANIAVSLDMTQISNYSPKNPNEMVYVVT